MFKNIHIGARLALFTGGALSLLMIVGFVGIQGMRTIYADNTVSMILLGETLDGLHWRRGNILLALGASSDSEAKTPFDEADKSVDRLNAAWQAYAAALTGERKARTETFERAWNDYRESSAQTITLAGSGDYEKAVDNLKGDAKRKFAVARESLVALMAQEKEDAGRAIDRAVGLISAVVLAGLLAGGWVSWRIIRSITRPVAGIRAIIAEVEAHSDFTRRASTDGRDEIGQMARSFNALMEAMQGTLRSILDNVGQASSAAHQLSAYSATAASSSAGQSEAASTMAATMEEITVSINHVSDSARAALDISREAGELSGHGGTVIQGAAAEMTKIADAVRRTSAVIEDLGAKSNEISSVVQVIKEVAEQTNLLALNAAIEAARAGEQGRGFAVVADEVRKLAERTTQATVEIGQMIAAIQASGRAAVGGMNEAVAKVDSGAAQAQQAGEAIGRIRDGAARVIAVVGDISSALVEQSSASQDIARHVERVARMSEESNATADAAAEAARRMERLSDAVREAVGRFRI